MKEKNNQLRDHIIEFIGLLEDCYRETTHASDRPIFAQDIAAAAYWIVELKRGQKPEVIIEKILSPETDKQFLDYWRSGEWGDRSADALQDLRAAIRSCC